MPKKDSRSGIILFTIGVIVAGACNALAKTFTKINSGYIAEGGTELPFFSTLLFALNLAIYLFLFFYWIFSVQKRILPSRTRSYIIWSGVSMIYFIVYHAVKYRVFELAQYPVMRFMWYSIYIPLLLIPTFFLMTSIRVQKGDRNSGFDERLLLIPCIILIALVMTNTFHHFVFYPVLDYELCGIPQTYGFGFLYYIIYAYIILSTIIGLVVLTIVNGRLKKPLRTAAPFLLLLLIPVMFIVNRVLTLNNLPQPFLFTDMAMLYAIAVFESCIRSRLIPYNEDYAGLFGKMTLPAVVTDKRFNRVYETAEAIEASAEELERSISSPVYYEGDIRLSGKPIGTGFVFWTEDESELHIAERKLRVANEKIATENILIQAENRVKEEKARLDFHNSTFEKIAEHITPVRNTAIELSIQLEPEKDDFDKKAARILALDAYIKRCINMMLLGEGKKDIRSIELIRSVNESANYLKYCGMEVVAVNRMGDQIDSTTAVFYYDAFERISDSLIDRATELSVTFYKDKMLITADCKSVPEIKNADICEIDGEYQFTVSACESGGAV